MHQQAAHAVVGFINVQWHGSRPAGLGVYMAGEAQRSGTTTLLITDIVRSTELMERLGDEVAVSITLEIIALLREVAQAHGGEEIKLLGDV